MKLEDLTPKQRLKAEKWLAIIRECINSDLSRPLLAIFIHLYEKIFRYTVTTGILYNTFNACTILLTLSM